MNDRNGERALVAHAPSGYLRALIVALLCFMAVPAQGAQPIAPTPQDFALGLPIEATGGAALFHVALPEVVYQTATRTDLGDLRVFNAAGEVVPHLLRTVATSTARPSPATSIPHFELHGRDEARGANLEIRVTRSSDGSLTRVVQTPDRNQRLIGYLLDTSAIDATMQAVELQLASSNSARIGSVTLEASEDLAHWREITHAVTLADLQQSGQRLLRNRIEFSALKTKYLRLSWPLSDTEWKLANVLVEHAPLHQDTARVWRRVLAQPVAGKAGEFVVDAGGRMPIDHILFDLPQANSVVSIAIDAESGKADAWHQVSALSVHRITHSGHELTSPPARFGPLAAQKWRLRVDTRGGGIGAGALWVNLGWLPHDLLFVARGSGPFMLAFGSRRVGPAEVRIDHALPNFQREFETNLGFARFTAARTAQETTPRSLGGSERLTPIIDWKRYLLWATLGVGVALLAYMAWRLARGVDTNRR